MSLLNFTLEETTLMDKIDVSGILEMDISSRNHLQNISFQQGLHNLVLLTNASHPQLNLHFLTFSISNKQPYILSHAMFLKVLKS